MAENPTPGDVEHDKKSPRIIVQAGAYKMHNWELKENCMVQIKNAAKEGYAALKNGGTAIDAVEKAVSILENHGNFGAGLGSFLNINGEVECDAMIMDGSTMKTGAVMAVLHFLNPVTLSREVMNKTDHCALCGDGALEFARNNNIPFLDDPNELIAGSRSLRGRENWNFNDFVRMHYAGMPVPCKESELPTNQANQVQCDQRMVNGNDSVSAVAMDTDGHLACALSTGGIPGKMKGRIGDVPLVGCGGYANEFGAATSSGHGEQIMKMTLARQVVFNMETGQNAQESAEDAVQRMENRVQGYGGVIAIDQHGNFGKAFNTTAMGWATIGDDVLKYGMKQDEFETELI